MGDNKGMPRGIEHSWSNTSLTNTNPNRVLNNTWKNNQNPLVSTFYLIGSKTFEQNLNLYDQSNIRKRKEQVYCPLKYMGITNLYSSIFIEYIFILQNPFTLRYKYIIYQFNFGFWTSSSPWMSENASHSHGTCESARTLTPSQANFKYDNTNKTKHVLHNTCCKVAHKQGWITVVFL